MALNDGPLADAIDPEVDDVLYAPRLNFDPAAFAVQHEWHGDDRLERVALCAAGRTHVCFPR
jgi:hypothetical protein